jgi:RHS repeat-associated protein
LRHLTCDGDGNRVKSTIGGVTTTFIGNYYEVSGSSITKYYGVYPEQSRRAGTQRIAMRVNGIVYFILSDQLGSVTLTTDAAGHVLTKEQYTAWGQVRYSNGNAMTNYTYTGQYSYTNSFGLMYYNARWYDPSIGRFAHIANILITAPESTRNLPGCFLAHTRQQDLAASHYKPI